MTKGYKTTEFWVTTLTSLVVIANQSGVLGDFVLPVEAIATIAAIVGAYIVSRGVAKINS
tara:strand:- start:402 stop:581 length:180 start_codon:yes stop_codon:yes gene_type:complete